MSKASFSSHFRNPLFIFMFYLVMVLPHFTIFCAIDLSGTLFWTNMEVCANTFIVDSFLENSIWSLLFIVLIFECLRWGDKVFGVDKKSLSAQTQAKVFLMLFIAFVCWLAISSAFEWLATSIGRTFPVEHPINLFFKVQAYGFIAFHLNSYLQRRYLKKHPLQKTIEVHDGIKSLTIILGDIQWAEKIGKKYFLFSKAGRFKVDKNLQELETLLPGSNFKRINRSAIVNINEIAGFSFWENEKYVLKLNNGKEFVMTRKRLNELKNDIQQTPKTSFFWGKVPLLKVFPSLRN
ncbi:LytTR family DNA-binding domain-containing protein [Flagellimonas flava]|uniref:LytTr DNA-binding domain-containing protein n=1 Tax=Flagellimonas flava TaxID=570519 RepID=A0A1M5M3T5_9FLAO|nr:LytTR family DNA-binding domain-containing protein [Allomuricauda flava]SHG71918.1 LytTr DNA-binding domain-containing protein [Allomuricauda flava]